jgi:hypothetical protein
MPFGGYQAIVENADVCGCRLLGAVQSIMESEGNVSFLVTDVRNRTDRKPPNRSHLSRRVAEDYAE